jgi:hypothetical protein
MARGYSVDPAVAQAGRRLGLAQVIEEVLVPEFMAALKPAELREIAENCIRVVTGRTGQPRAFSHPYRGEGVVVVLDGALLLIFFDLLGHALSLVNAISVDNHDQLHSHWPTAHTAHSLASLISAFFQPWRGFDHRDLPVIAATGPGGLPPLRKFLEAGERFIVGHEIAHALTILGQLGEEPGVRDLIRSSAGVAKAVEDRWVAELSADVTALRLVESAAGNLPGQRSVGLAGCILALMNYAMLERVAIMPSSVPWPPDPSYPPDFTKMSTHPPVDLRLHIVCSVAAQEPGAVELARPYQMAVVALLDGINKASGRKCIATMREPYGWCGRARALDGWFCQAHGPRLTD